MRQPEGEDEHGFDPAVIFKRYLWDTDPAEELTEARPPNLGLEGQEEPPAGLEAMACPEGLGLRQAGAGRVGVVVATVVASGWPAVQPGRNAADQKLPSCCCHSPLAWSGLPRGCALPAALFVAPATLRTHAERAALRPPTAPEATHGACLDLKPYACVSTIRGVQHSGNDGRIELETLSAAELGEMVKRHESGVGPAIIHRLRQLQMGAKIREAQARRTAAQGTG